MKRRPGTSYALVAGTLAFVMGCAGSSEQKVLEDFFRASRLRDNTTLGNFATTSFDPRTDGVMQDFEVVSISEERSRPLPLRQYAKALEEARARDEAFSQQKRAYQNANIAAIDRVMKAEASQRAVATRDNEVKTAWDKWVADAAQHTKAVSDAQHQLASGRGIAELSLARQRDGSTLDVTQLDGEMLAKDVVIDATVRGPGGEMSRKRLKVVLQRAHMTGAAGEDITGRWIVTSVSPE